VFSWQTIMRDSSFLHQSQAKPPCFGLSTNGYRQVWFKIYTKWRVAQGKKSRTPQLTFVGSDMDEAIISACRERWTGLNNLSFTVVRLDRLEPWELDPLKSDLVYASGGLNYLAEPSLRKFLTLVRPLTRRILFAEPLAIDFLMDDHSHSTPRGDFAWSHPYTSYLVDAGWAEVRYEIGFLEQHYWAKMVNFSCLSREVTTDRTDYPPNVQEAETVSALLAAA